MPCANCDEFQICQNRCPKPLDTSQILSNGWSGQTFGVEPDWSEYDAIEIMCCIEETSPDGNVCVTSYLPTEAQPCFTKLRNDTPITYWAVYGHVPEGGADCLHDGITKAEAEVLASYCETKI
jgi:hypothetical protein